MSPGTPALVSLATVLRSAVVENEPPVVYVDPSVKFLESNGSELPRKCCPFVEEEKTSQALREDRRHQQGCEGLGLIP